MAYVSATAVLAELPKQAQLDTGLMDSYIATAEGIARKKIGTLPTGDEVLAAAIRGYAVGKALEKANWGQSKEVVQNAQKAQENALKLMDLVDAADVNPEEPPGDASVAYYRPCPF